VCNNYFVPRKYQLKRRAERQDETRRRIVDSTIALHTTVGPARTTVKAIAHRAGVQRHTVYKHFPDDRLLNVACSGRFMELHPLPDPATWRQIGEPEQRLRHGLSEVYGYYERHAGELAPILRDADVHPLTREMIELRFAPQLTAMVDALAEPFRARGKRAQRLRAVLHLVLEISTWRTLTTASGREEVAEVASRAVCAQ
jgi:AcrR family transcriptional regulator